MYGIYANIGGILMVFMLPYIAYMDPMAYLPEQCYCTLFVGFTMIFKNRHGKANNKSSPIEVYQIWALVGMMHSLSRSHGR